MYNSDASTGLLIPKVHLQNAIDGPEGEKPGQGVSSAKGEVDGCSGHEAARQHDPWGRACAQHSAHKLGEPVGDGEQGCQGPDL